MNIYPGILAFLADQSPFPDWPEAREVLRRAAAEEPHDWQLPVLACRALGGTAEQALPAAAAVACLQISIRLIDDLLDADPRGEHHRLGTPATANLAAAIQAAGLEALARCAANAGASDALAGLNRATLATALGQYWDSLNPADEAGYWRVVETKSAPFFGAALHAGALLGGADGEVAAQFERLGRLYGEIIQIHDDLHDSLAVPANADWTMGRAPLPILFAQIVQHPDRERFLELRRAIPDPDALAQAQAILIRSGAVSYGIHALLIRHETAQSLLAAMPLRRREEVEELLERQVEPVRELFRVIGTSPDAIGLTPPE